MDSIQKADIVISTAGREKGIPFMVFDVTDDFVSLVDGKYRKMENPKRKNKKHVRLVKYCETRVSEKLKNSEKVTNSEIRRNLSEYLSGQDAEAFKV